MNRHPPIARVESASTSNPAWGLTDFSLLIVVAIWGVNFVVVRASLSQFSPMTFCVLRVVLASLALVSIAAIKRPRLALSPRDGCRLVLLGLVGFVFTQIMFVNGLARTTASNAGIIQASVPILVAVTNHLLRLEFLSMRGWTGVILTVVGLVIVIFGGSHSFTFVSETFYGNLLIVGSTLGWVTYTVMARPLLRRVPLTVLTAGCMLTAAVVLAFIGSSSVVSQDWSAVTSAGWAGLLFAGLASMTLGQIVWAKGLQKLGATRTSIYSNLSPVVAVIAGVLFLHERMTLFQLVGATAVLTGIFLARTRSATQNGHLPR